MAWRGGSQKLHEFHYLHWMGLSHWVCQHAAAGVARPPPQQRLADPRRSFPAIFQEF